MPIGSCRFPWPVAWLETTYDENYNVEADEYPRTPSVYATTVRTDASEGSSQCSSPVGYQELLGPVVLPSIVAFYPDWDALLQHPGAGSRRMIRFVNAQPAEPAQNQGHEENVPTSPDWGDEDQEEEQLPEHITSIKDP